MDLCGRREPNPQLGQQISQGTSASVTLVMFNPGGRDAQPSSTIAPTVKGACYLSLSFGHASSADWLLPKGIETERKDFLRGRLASVQGRVLRITRGTTCDPMALKGLSLSNRAGPRPDDLLSRTTTTQAGKAPPVPGRSVGHVVSIRVGCLSNSPWCMSMLPSFCSRVHGPDHQPTTPNQG